MSAWDAKHNLNFSGYYWRGHEGDQLEVAGFFLKTFDCFYGVLYYIIKNIIMNWNNLSDYILTASLLKVQRKTFIPKSIKAQKICSKMYCILYANTHHDDTTFKVAGMV